MASKVLTVQERRELTGILSRLTIVAVGGATGVQVLLQQAGLDRFISELTLSGPARTVAGELIGKVEPFGELEESPGYLALGALLDAMLNEPELPRDDARFVARLIVRYSLVHDSDVIQSLRERFDITEAVPLGQRPSPPLASGTRASIEANARLVLEALILRPERAVKRSELLSESGLSEKDFDLADNYLFKRGLVKGSPGPDGWRWPTQDGHDFWAAEEQPTDVGGENSFSYREELLSKLTGHFSETELANLFFEMGGDYEALPGQGKAGKAREIILYLERRDRILELIQKAVDRLPNADWPSW